MNSNSMLLSSIIIEIFIIFEIFMLNSNINKTKKIDKKKKYFLVVNILKKFIEAITFTKQILDIKISLIIKK